MPKEYVVRIFIDLEDGRKAYMRKPYPVDPPEGFVWDGDGVVAPIIVCKHLDTTPKKVHCCVFKRHCKAQDTKRVTHKDCLECKLKKD